MSAQTNYFPLFLTLHKKKILLLGGGKIATDKLLKLIEFTNDIKVIAKEFSDDILKVIDKNRLTYEKREYVEHDIDGFDIVVVAVDDIELQKKVYHDSRDKRVLVNSVDVKEYCDFIFGSIIKKDELVIAISTSGSSPSIAKYLKIFLEKSLPENLSLFLKKMKKLRESLPKGKERMKLLDEKTKEFFDLVQ